MAEQDPLKQIASDCDSYKMIAVVDGIRTFSQNEVSHNTYHVYSVSTSTANRTVLTTLL